MSTRREFIRQAAIAGVVTTVGHPIATLVQAAIPDQQAIPEADGIVQTVQGPLDASRLGFTLPHEHLFASSAGFWRAWPEHFGGRASFIAKVVDKLKAARDEGITTVVDLTPVDVGRDIRFLEEVSRKSGMQIIACTGHWLHPALSMEARTVEELAEFFTLEIERGIEGTDIKAGIIKVATSREGVTPFIDRALRAAARVSKATGIPISTHSHASSRTGDKQAAIFAEEGVDPAAVCIGHSDDTADVEYLLGLAKRGNMVGMDHWIYGIQESVPSADEKALSADSTGAGPLHWHRRAESVKKLVDAGFGNKILLSNDWFFGLSIAATGTMEAFERRNPDGILFLSRKVLPHLARIGVSDQVIRTITVDNPRRLLAHRSS